MTTKDTSGPIYPCGNKSWARSRHGDAGSDFILAGYVEPKHVGLTKREYFAGLAMQGTIASQVPDESIDPVMCAQWCFQMADAMIAEGNKQ